MNEETREAVSDYFNRIAFKETFLPPGDTYQGVLFFRGVSGEGDRFERTLFRARALYQQGALRLDVVLTSLGEGQRIRFGPFSVASPSPFLCE